MCLHSVGREREKKINFEIWGKNKAVRAIRLHWKKTNSCRRQQREKLHLQINWVTCIKRVN